MTAFKKSLLFSNYDHNNLLEDILLNLDFIFSNRSFYGLNSFVGWKIPEHICLDNINEVENDIKNAINKLENRIEVVSIKCTNLKNILNIKIIFKIKSLNEQKSNSFTIKI